MACLLLSHFGPIYRPSCHQKLFKIFSFITFLDLFCLFNSAIPTIRFVLLLGALETVLSR